MNDQVNPDCAPLKRHAFADFDDLASDAGHLKQLIDVACETAMEATWTDPMSPEFVRRINAVLWVSRDLAERLEAAIEAAGGVRRAEAVTARKQAGNVGPIEYLSQKWTKARNDFNADGAKSSDDSDENSIFAQLIAIETAAQALEPMTVREYAFKIIMADDFGSMDFNVAQGALVPEAMAMVGWQDTSRERRSFAKVQADAVKDESMSVYLQEVHAAASVAQALIDAAKTVLDATAPDTTAHQLVEDAAVKVRLVQIALDVASLPR